jgi:hypothetical protein
MRPSITSRHRRSLSTPVDALEASDLRAELSVAFDDAGGFDDDDDACDDGCDVYEDMDEEVAKLFDAKTKRSVFGGTEGVTMETSSASAALAPLDVLGDEIPMDVREIALTDPKRARRILANRQSAARSKERKLRYLSGLETRAAVLEAEESALREEEEELRRLVAALGAENSAMEMFATTTTTTTTTTTNTSANTSNGNGVEGASQALKA